MATCSVRPQGENQGAGPVSPGAFHHASTSGLEKLRHAASSDSLETSSPHRSPCRNRRTHSLAPPPPQPGPRRSFARAHREPGRQRKMSFPAARWRCQLIGSRRGPRAGLGASLAAAGAQLSGKNWGGCCGEISYRSLGGAAGPRSAQTAADPGQPRWAGDGERGRGGGPASLLPHPPPSYTSSSPRPRCGSALSSPIQPLAVSTHR